MIKADLTMRDPEHETDKRAILYVDHQTHNMSRILKLATGLNHMEVVNASLKIACVLSGSLSGDDWKEISKTNDLQEVVLILICGLIPIEPEKFKRNKPMVHEVEEAYKLGSIDEGLKRLLEAHYKGNK